MRSGTGPRAAARLWLWRRPAPAGVQRELAARGARRLEAPGGPAALLAAARAAGAECFAVLEAEAIAEGVALALGLRPGAAAALQVDEGRGVALADGPGGWALERSNVAGTAPPIAALR